MPSSPARGLRAVAPLLVPALAGALLVTAPVATSATAATCRATPALLSRTPTTTRLAGGLSARIWDTGPTPSNPQASTRIVVVRVPASSALHPRVRAAAALTKASTPSAYLKGAPGAVVMVNGGVFDPTRGALPDLPQMVGGQVTKARSVKDAVIAVSKSGASVPTKLWLTGSASAGSKGARTVTGLNWQAVTEGVTVYTTAWGSQSRPYGSVDVVVVGGKVVALRTGTSRGKVPASGQTILTGTGATATWLSSLRVGNAVSVSYAAHTDASIAVWEAVGRGARYLNAGVKNGGTCGARDELLRPRTAIGWTKAGDLLFVTVSGRATVNGVRYGGATIHQMADYLQKLGAWNATNLDGGGSTTMLARLPSGTVVRLDRGLSEAQRAVPNVFSAG
ncbi:hypothetical protein ASD62_01080 [Phycicoccus sp. Root563]|uniref:phosphodiester glycosidase family protein n=1 Tax=unclassified Phycicoccus TaxID=2637926 RepID=UPI0007025571|nr:MULTISPECIES: phosphodiester glycosidase family protein [unclassified Phycicoccus]KQU68629.1 hypothetical protein ASC58_07925 [Phycicoccus sp. Root101]KQZ88121.1 hypothetical protein ASD62_01080 [Phycicoccus sp. Root563]